ncbi:MAG: ABC transporter permease [Sulfolobales archaeon]
MSYNRTIIKSRTTLWRCLRRADFKVGVTIIAALILIATLSSVIAPYPDEGAGLITEAAKQRGPQPPSAEHPFGTDIVGRDMLSRVLIGSCYSLIQTILVIFGSLSIGVILGVFAGYIRGIVEAVVNYAIELFLLLPSVIVAAALSVIIGPGMLTVVLSLILTWWAWYARIAYVQSRQVRELDFIKVSEALGFRRVYIAFRHVLPNVAPPVVVQSMIDTASVLLEIATINFLIGSVSASLDTPDWGMMIGYGFRYITTYWWMSFFPGLFLVVTAFGFILVGDAVSEESSPNLRRRWRQWF